MGLGFVKAFWNSGSACMNLILAKFVRAACGMSSALRLASVDFPQQGFQGRIVARFEGPLLLRVFGYAEPGTAAAATNGVGKPFDFHRGACPSFGPSLSHRVHTRCGRTLFGDLRLFSVHIPLKTMDICGRKVPYVPGVGAQIAGAVPAARVTYSGALQPITLNGRRYVGSERPCLPP